MGAIAALLFLIGVFALIASWGMLIIASFKEDYAWGLCSILLPPLAYFVGLLQWKKAKDALLTASLGIVILFLSTSV
jgi:hypothetical protein